MIIVNLWSSKSYTVEEVQDFAKKCHNPDLVKPDEAPNANRITHIYEDGEITNQKGGSAYGQRSETTDWSAMGITGLNVEMPIKRNGHSYAMVTDDDARKILDMMKKITFK